MILSGNTADNSIDEPLLRFRDIIAGRFRRRVWIFPVFVAASCLLGSYFYYITPPSYRSVATIEVAELNRSTSFQVDTSAAMVNEAVSASARLRLPILYAEAANGYFFADRRSPAPEQRRYPWIKTAQSDLTSADVDPDSLAAMLRESVTVRLQPGTPIIDIEAVHTDPLIARDTILSLLSASISLTESEIPAASGALTGDTIDRLTASFDSLTALEGVLEIYRRCSRTGREIAQTALKVSEVEGSSPQDPPPSVESKKALRDLIARLSSDLDQAIYFSEEERSHWERSLTDLSGLSEDKAVELKLRFAASRLEAIQREFEAEKVILNSLLRQFSEVNHGGGFERVQYKVIQPPTTPKHPISPAMSEQLIRFVCGGAALATGMIILLGVLDPGVFTVSDLERISGLRVIAALPSFTSEDKHLDILTTSRDPSTRSAEAVRTLRTWLTLFGTAGSRSTVLITSSIPEEGKSWIAANLAASFAIKGEMTLLIDANLRNPAQAGIFRYAEDTQGLSEHLSLGTSVGSLILRSDVSPNLFILPAGSRLENPAELLTGDALPPLLAKLSDYYTRIVIDSAPILPVSDSLVLAKLARSVVLVTKMGKTPKTAIRRSLRSLSSIAFDPVGLVANGLPRSFATSVFDGGRTYSRQSFYTNYKNTEIQTDTDNSQVPRRSRQPGHRERPDVEVENIE